MRYWAHCWELWKKVQYHFLQLLFHQLSSLLVFFLLSLFTDEKAYLWKGFEGHLFLLILLFSGIKPLVWTSSSWNWALRWLHFERQFPLWRWLIPWFLRTFEKKSLIQFDHFWVSVSFRWVWSDCAVFWISCLLFIRAWGEFEIKYKSRYVKFC